MNFEAFFQSLQQCRINLMDNGELIVVPEAVQCGDVISILVGAHSQCTLKLESHGNWSLVSGDCYMFTKHFEDATFGRFMCDEYIKCNQDKVEEFILR
jgi:hypothetical protein